MNAIAGKTRNSANGNLMSQRNGD